VAARGDLRHLVRVSVLLHDLVQGRVPKAAHLRGSEALVMVVSNSRWRPVERLLRQRVNKERFGVFLG